MLQKLAGHITDCLDRAASAERRAAETADLALKADYQQVARNWRQLAASYQFAESLERFILDSRHAENAPPRMPDWPE